jgi:hypothetical protein
MATQNAEWPAISLPSGAARLIDLFFSFTELKSPEAGRRLADEVFLPSGEFVAPHGTSTGTEGRKTGRTCNPLCTELTGHLEITKSREHAWDAIDARKHEISKVYASDASGTDLMILGSLTATKKDGTVTTTKLVGRIIFGTDANGQLRFKLYQAQAWGK